MRRLFLRFYGGIFMAIFIAFGIAVGIIKSSIDRQLNHTAPPLAEWVMGRLQAELAEATPAERAEMMDDLFAETSMAAQVVAGDSPAVPEQARLALARGEGSVSFASGGLSLGVPLPDGRVMLFGPVKSGVHPTGTDFTLILLVLLGVVGLIAGCLTVPMARRLHHLERAANRLGEGDLDARAPERPGDDPVDRLARRFNTMADRVQGLLRSQQQLVQAMAHEFRTPIARLKFGLEMAEMARNLEDRQRRVGALQEDLEEMEALVAELLLFSRYEQGQARPSIQSVPIRATVERQVERLGHGPTGISVELNPAEGAPAEVQADARAFNRVLGNLLSNAMRHAQQRIEVSWCQVGEQVELAVSDDGPGIPEADRQRVFEPFMRLEQARDRARGGVGLGLAIVYRILDAHGGSVLVETASGGGARLVTRWPGATPRQKAPTPSLPAP